MRAWPFLFVACFIGACGGVADTSSGFVPVPDGAVGGDDAATGPAVDPFADAPPFTPGSATWPSILAAHADPEVAVNPTGKDCFTSNCHGGLFPEKPLLFGGTIYTDATGKTPAVGVEIRVVDANGVATSVYSDQQGNFYKLSAASLALPAHPGVRTAANSLAMVGDSTDRSCNKSGCHDGPTQAKVYAP